MKKEKKQDVSKELAGVREYLTNESNEDAKRKFVYPLFNKLFGEAFKTESDAEGADGYVAGKFVVELKSKPQDWVGGFFQAMHYEKKGLSFPTVIVLCQDFIAVWRLERIPEFAVILAHTTLASLAPNEAGKDLARRVNKAQAQEILDSAIFKMDSKDIAEAKKDLRFTLEIYNFLQILNNLDANRIAINPMNFIETIGLLKKYFEKPIDAVHAFYNIVGFWDINSVVNESPKTDEICVIGYKGKQRSDLFTVPNKHKREFIKFVENRYVFTNEGSGLTVDYYFSRFDEVLAEIDPEYVKQHGIFFTDSNLSKLALWFVNEYFAKDLGERYIVFDPAGGSGNLIASYKGKLKHKIISELSSDLLQIVEKRIKYDPYHIETGYTIIPKTNENKGLNFLDKTGKEYLDIIREYLKESGLDIDKPLAFLLNPPYKNTDENEKVREDKNASYGVHPSIFNLTGEDAGKERYLAFLAQILNICAYQKELYPDVKPLLMVFTPTSWLIPRSTYAPFRQVFDAHFVYQTGFITTSNEFFKLDGKWPVAFTIWRYEPQKTDSQDNTPQRQNTVKVYDATELTSQQLKQLDWEDKETTNFVCGHIFKKTKLIALDNSKGDIREDLPEIAKNQKLIKQPRYDFSHSKKEEDFGKLVSGFPLKDKKNHFELRRKCGDTSGLFIGFMDDNTPVRLAQDTCLRMSNEPDRVWCMLMSAFSSVNLSQVQSGAQNSRSYCAYDLASAKVLFSWFGISKAVNGRYPLWANQYEIWSPDITPALEKYYYSLCFAFALAENRCVVTKFEANNPVAGAPEVYVHNPLCPTNPDSFWSEVLEAEITQDKITYQDAIFEDKKESNLAYALVQAVKDLYRFWNLNYCKGQTLKNVGLQDEPYFKYFDYSDFVTPYSGLVQIRKYSEVNGASDLMPYLQNITDLSRLVKDEIYRLLMEEFEYFV